MPPTTPARQSADSVLRRITDLFPLWAVLAAAAAFLIPESFVPLRPAIPYLLGAVMFGMGMTLSFASFRAILTRPRIIALGLALQYGLMPALAWVIAWWFALPPHLAAGLILLGAAPGGTASNVICYLAGANVALSISLTTASTLLSIFATPWLTWLYVGTGVPVDAGAMLFSILQMVLLPVLAGTLLNSYLPSATRRLAPGLPLLSVLAICLIIAIVVALNAGNLADLAGVVLAAVVLHNLGGLAAGYLMARAFGSGRRTARTLAIEVGMQNSGLAVALALQFFDAIAALPGALFSVWHNLSGALLAGYWRRRRRVRTAPRQAAQSS